MNQHTFPPHIYDSDRVALAMEIMQKELRKLFLDLPNDAWGLIDKSIVGWADQPTKYHLDDEKLRDFWDIFAAIMESIKLKPAFTAMLTAQNMHWSKKTLPVREIQMTSPLDQLQKVPGLNLRSDLPFAELIDVLASNPSVTEQQRKIIDQYSTDPQQDKFRIITRKTSEGLYRAMDGNRRTLKAILYGQPTIEAWVGELDGDEPQNFWIPINDMFQLVKVFKYAQDHGDKNTMQSVIRVLSSHFEVSQVAEIAYKTRVSNQNAVAKQLYDLAKQVKV